MEFIHLTGSEEVSRAGNVIRGAAGDMQTAANTIQTALDDHSRFMDDWLYRLQEMLNSINQ